MRPKAKLHQLFGLVMLVTSTIAEREDDGGTSGDVDRQICHHDPLDCDGVGISHLPLHQTLSYVLNGTWELQLDSKDEDDFKPRVSSKQVDIEGHVYITRVSVCRVKVVLQNYLVSDWEDSLDRAESWIVVSGGTVRTVCNRGDPLDSSMYMKAHATALIRSVMSATMNVVPLPNDEKTTVTEIDHMGKCETQYQTVILGPGMHSQKRTRDLRHCVDKSNRKSNYKPLSHLTSEASWECEHIYNEHSRLDHSIRRTVSALENPALSEVVCRQNVILPNASNFNAGFNMELVDIQSWTPEDYIDDDSFYEVDLRLESFSSIPDIMPEGDRLSKIHGILSDLCHYTKRSISPRGGFIYAQLMKEMKNMDKNTLVHLYREISNGNICPDYQKLESFYSSALRDVTSSEAAAAKCQLMASRTIDLSRLWIASLANVQDPTPEALEICSQLLEGGYWKDAALGVSALARNGIQKACWGERSYQCNFENPGCTLGNVRGCEMGRAVQIVIKNLAAHLPKCVSRGSVNNHQLLLAIRGLGNIGTYGYDVENYLMTCGGPEIDYAVRLASLATIKRGSCNLLVTNWLKWLALNETEKSELRITAFQSLHYCYPEEAEAVGLLITEKDSNNQVKSYVSAYITNGGKSGDARQFSRRLTTNLTSAFGLPETLVETDVVFQNSLVPQSVAFNITSKLLQHHGGSVQFGGRLENLEEVLQSIFGHSNSAGNSVVDWLSTLLTKAQEIFSSASEDFVKEHEREKRSYDVADVKNLLRKVKKEVLTELRGWVFAGIGNFDQFFDTFSVDPFAIDWEDLLDDWTENLLESSYAFLMNSNVEITNGWSYVDETALTWSVLGFPLSIEKQEGILYSAGARSRVSLLELIKNPSASTLNLGLSASAGSYFVSHMSLPSLSGNVVAEYASVQTKSFDVSAVLKIQGSDNAELKLDFPRDSFQGEASQYVRHLNLPTLDAADEEPYHSLIEEGDESIEAEVSCKSARTPHEILSDDDYDESHGGPVSKRHCRSLFGSVVGLSAHEDNHLVQGQYKAMWQTRQYLKKSEDTITGYNIGFSAKNPGSNSFFLDMYVEAEGTSRPQKAGVVFGLTYSPHFTIKVILQSQQLTASGEATLVNDPNLKRFEGHVGFGRSEYGIKAELLMVEDGGQVSVKPRLVISYPGQQEDALLEGYLARYVSDKVSSLTVDLYTEGTLKQYWNVALKGTAEYRAPKGRGKLLAFKNVHLSTPHFTLGLESMLTLKDDSVEAKIQATLDGEVVVIDGTLSGQGSGQDNQQYAVNMQLLLPEKPHVDTKIICITKVLASEVSNNITLTVGEGETQREFQAFHSTTWRITNPLPPPTPAVEGASRAEDRTISHNYGPFAGKVTNKFKVTSLAADIDWDIDHVLQVSNKSIENHLAAKIGDADYKIMGNVFDQSQEFFKYHMELEISLPDWHFSYVDTLQQQPNGDMIGKSTTVMPSGRIYSTSSRLYKNTIDDRIIFEGSYDIHVRDGVNVWKIVLQESFDWSNEHLHMQSNIDVGEITIFGLEIAVDGMLSGDTVFHFKNWVKNLFEGELTLNNEGTNMDFNMNVLIIPFNREIKSKIALGHDGCKVGLLDGEVAWDVRGDSSRTVMLTSMVQLPKDGQPLEIKGSVSVLSWTWKAGLVVVLGENINDNHRLTFTLTLPDDSRFQLGSQFDFSVAESNVALLTSFDIQMPNEDLHNVTLAVRGLLSSEAVADGMVTFDVQSPKTDEVHFHVEAKMEKDETIKKISVVTKTHSAANFWEPIDVKANGVWDGTTANLLVESTWGTASININNRASYWILDGEHRVSGDTEVKLPLGKSWKQLKCSLSGSFSVGQNPGRLKVTHSMNIEKDLEEIFQTEGEVSVLVPKVEGRLIISHSGAVAKYHTYDVEGSFTGKKLEIDVDGVVDEVPLKVSLMYIDGQEVTVKAYYKNEDFFHTQVKTELKDVSFGIRKGKGTSYTLTTEGLLVYKRQRSQLFHELYISPSHGSSTLRLVPVQGNAFELTTSRTKYNNHHWGTVISLEWGQRTFNYRDDIYFPSFSECVIKIELDAPDFNITKVTAEVAAATDSYGEQEVQVKYLVQNDTIHSARLMYYIHGSEDEIIWRAGAQNLVVSAKPYSDLQVSHAIMKPVGGMEIKSNMTVGLIPIVGIGVKVTPHTRALLLSVCTTSEKCIRLHAHAHAQNTPSTRTYSVAAHALNSLLWKDPEDSLIQSSLTFSAKETLDAVIVAGGIRRVECHHVICDNFIVREVLHATLQFTEEDMEILLDTTNRTMKFKSIVRESHSHEIAPTSLPGGRLLSTSTLETQFWIDFSRDPEGMINWNSTLLRYASSISSEWVIRSGLYHQSFRKVLILGGQLTVEPMSVRMLTLFDVFSDVEDALRLNLEMLHDHGNQVIIANLTKAVEGRPRLIDVVVSFLPSPDSGEVNIVLIVPSNEHTGDMTSTTSEYHETRFTLTCGLDSPHKYTTISCRLITPSVDEKVYVRYQFLKDRGCRGLSTSLGLLHHNYNAQQKSCRYPNSFQASISTKTEKVKEKELAIRLGVLDRRSAELDVIDAIHVKFQLHSPFLLHAMAHSRGTFVSRWEAFKKNAQIEISELFDNAKSVATALALDARALKTLSSIAAPSPAALLANYTQVQGKLLLAELEGDALIRELTNNAQMCIDVTSVLIDAGIAYLNHNYGALIMDVGAKALIMTKRSVENMGVWLLNTATVLQDALTSSIGYISQLPQRTLDYAFTLPVIGDGTQWVIDLLNQVKKSYGYVVVKDVLISIGHNINWGMSLLYPSNEDLFSDEFISEAWNLWVPLPECSHSLLDVWNFLMDEARSSSHKLTLPAAVVQWWHRLTHPSALLDYLFPPFPAHSAIIGETNMITMDGQTFSLNSTCAHILLTDTRDRLFTLVSELHGTPAKRSYAIFLRETVIRVQPDFQVTINGRSIILPYSSARISVTRDLQHLTVATFDKQKRDLMSLTCWTNRHACVVSVSGWLHADTRGLLGHFNLNPADDLMRPSGQIALSGDIFSHSWQVGSFCPSEKTTIELPSSVRARQLCRKFLLDLSSPTFPCQETIDVMPYYEMCVRYLATFEDKSGPTTDEQVEPIHERPSDNRTDIVDVEFSGFNPDNATAETPASNFSNLHISVKDLIFPFGYADNDMIDATSEELEALCNIMSSYFTVCKAEDINISLPPLCGSASKLNYSEAVSSDTKQADVVLLVDENSCDRFMYEHFIRPIPGVLERIGHGKNVSDVKVAAIGFGAGGGDIRYHIPGPSLLASASQLKLSQPHSGERARGSLMQSLRAVSNFPFRPGSVRVALAIRCSNQDLPQFTDTLPREMVRRRLTLFALTPDLLVFNPRRPKAVRNTIGVDRWRVYSLRHDKQASVDSWKVRRPSSNVAQLAMKSGGGVFTVAPLRDEPRSAYYMKLFRKVLSRAVMKAVNSIYNKSLRLAREKSH